MVNFIILIAEKKVSITAQYDTTKNFCKDYLCDGTPDFSITVTSEDISFERQNSKREYEAQGMLAPRYSDAYLEIIAVYRKIAAAMISYNTLLFHGSVISVDGEAYLFTAKSGTGKSTHTRLWRQAFGSRAFMVNDDKPLLKISESGVYACGTPWNGKHHLSTNCIVPLKAICILERGEQNSIQSISSIEALPMLLQQSYRPSDPLGMSKYLSIIDGLSKEVSFYRLKCNMEPDAALVAYQGMQRED